jgi:hypothetical protein
MDVAPANSGYNDAHGAIGQEIGVSACIALVEQPFLGLDTTPNTARIKRRDFRGIERTQNPYSLERFARVHPALQ